MGRAKQTLVAVAFTLVSCSTPVTPAATPIDQLTALRVYATTDTAPLLYDLSAAYRQRFPHIAFEINTGSYQAMAERVLRDDGAYFFSHYLPEDIDTSQSRYWAAPVGQDALTLLVHPDNPVANISLPQLRDVYGGSLFNWSEIGGVDRDIRVITREAGSGMQAEFGALVLGERTTTLAAQVVPSNEAMVESVATQPDAIGYGSLSDLTGMVRPLAVETVLPTSNSVYDSTYPLRLTIYIVGRGEPLDSDYPAMRAFIGWVQSPEGQAVVAQRYAPLLRP
ncbi:MAG: substrate-binding domain-containing protein [Chloroflexota bacterium]|nr:substrate-binding domain-containing protein [Chloroflexota bacterium]